jgi:uncharacterized protein (UPF0264 family)
MNWRGLLVSVRDATEAAAAVEGGAAIIDVKEPRRGSLGPAEPEAIAAVAEVVGASRPWTMACGELGGMSAAGPGRAGAAGIDSVAVAIGDRVARVFSLLSDNAVAPAAVKIGLAGAAATDWRQRLGAVYESLPTGSERVAVAYADWRQAGAPAPPQVIAAAADLGCSTLLIDTFPRPGWRWPGRRVWASSWRAGSCRRRSPWLGPSGPTWSLCGRRYAPMAGSVRCRPGWSARPSASVPRLKPPRGAVTLPLEQESSVEVDRSPRAAWARA